MRLLSPFPLLVFVVAALAGCIGSGDDAVDCDALLERHEAGELTEEEYDQQATDAGCTLHHEGGDDMTDGGDGNMTDGGDGNVNQNVTPNVPPVVTLKVTDANGTETNTVLVDGTLTFDASGSSDPDGELFSVAVTVQDRNRTQTANLYDGSGFSPATFTFDTPGVVNVTVSALDDRGDITRLNTNVFVNHPQSGSHIFTLFDATGVLGSADDCVSPTADPAGTGQFGFLERLMWQDFNFDVFEGATYVEATVTSGSASIAICSPDGEALSDAGESVTTFDGTNFTQSIDYYVSVISTGPGEPNNAVMVDITVHYEPKA